MRNSSSFLSRASVGKQNVGKTSASSRIKCLVNTYSGLVLMGAVRNPYWHHRRRHLCPLWSRAHGDRHFPRQSHHPCSFPSSPSWWPSCCLPCRGNRSGHELSIRRRSRARGAISRVWCRSLYWRRGERTFGGSAGREGVAVQIGATVSHWIGRRLRSPRPRQHVFCLSAWLHGFAGTFSNAARRHGLCYRSTSHMTHGVPRCSPRATVTRCKYDLRRPGLEKFEVTVAASYALDLPRSWTLALWASRLVW